MHKPMEVKEVIKNLLSKYDTNKKSTIKTLLHNHKVVHDDAQLKVFLLNIKSTIKIEIEETNDKTSFYKNILNQIGKAHKAVHTNQQNKLILAKKIASLCSREIKRALQKTGRTNISIKGKKFWKELQSTNKESKEIKRKAQREENERRKKELEKSEAERQARKLDFLINQTELYSHFVLNKKKIDLQITETDESSLQDAQSQALKAAEKQREIVNEYGHTEVENISQQPEILKAELKEYQFKGLKWLANLYNQGLNGILADDMGLGKTVQSISLLAYLFESKNLTGPFLVVTPTSTLPNWSSELERFLPTFSVLKYWGADRKKMKFNRFNLVLTSYSIVQIDEKIFNKTKWQYMILDEAQAIKSNKSQRWNKLLKIPCRNRLLLTGTPIQNNLKELWSLLHFIMPTLFDSLVEFEDWFMKMNSDRLERLHLILKPFMLRREKKDVATELKEKKIKVIFTDLSYRQRTMYEMLEKRCPVDLKDAEVANVLIHYRKVCNHPDLFHKSEVETGLFLKDQDNKSLIKKEIPNEIFQLRNEEKTKLNFIKNLRKEEEMSFEIKKDFDKFMFLKKIQHTFNEKMTKQIENMPLFYHEKVYNLPFDIKTEKLDPEVKRIKTNGLKFKLPELSNFILESGKLQVIDLLLAKLKEKHHRPLIYFQMTKMMSLFEDYLKLKKYSYLRLDGSTKLNERRELVRKWQNEDIFIFLLSTRAGGLGINLTAADTVIFYDSDWNPTVDKQAMDRAHRLGQLRDVTVYKLVCKNTVEERIMEMASKKDEIQRMVIEKGNFEGADI